MPKGIDGHDAKTIVEWVLGVSVETAPQNELPGPDFDLFESGRRTGAMVVARSDRPPHLQARGSVQRLSWEACALARSWVVILEAVTRSDPDERMIVGLIGELERAGGNRFHRADQVRVAALRAAGVRLSPAERVLEDLAVFGVVGAEPRSGHGTRPTVVAKVAATAATSAEVINETVEDEVWRVGNRARLGRTDVADRHMFVWLDPADVAADTAMDPDRVPEPPLLAPETTTLWVARRQPANHDLVADRVWQTDGSGGWEALGSVMRRRLVSPAMPGLAASRN